METANNSLDTPARIKPHQKKTAKCICLLFYDCVLFIGILAAVYPVYILNLELDLDSLHNLAEIKHEGVGLSSDEPYLYILDYKGQPIDMLNFILMLVEDIELERFQIDQIENSMDKETDLDEAKAKDGGFIDSKG